MQLFFDMAIVDEYGRVHGRIRQPIDDRAAFMGERIADDMRAGVAGFSPMGSPFEATVEILKVKEFRRDLLKSQASRCGGALADHLEDREGWHGIERQAAVEKSLKR